VITFQVYDGYTSTWRDLYSDTGTELSVTATDGKHIPIFPDTFPSINVLRLRSGTTGTPTNEAAARDVILWLRSRH
jgi:hypothetical protein